MSSQLNFTKTNYLQYNNNLDIDCELTYYLSLLTGPEVLWVGSLMADVLSYEIETGLLTKSCQSKLVAECIEP